MRHVFAAICLTTVVACAPREEPGYVFTELLYPGASETIAYGVNATGTVVGYYIQGDSRAGFIYRDGSYTAVTYPAAAWTQLYGIGDNGEIVGSYRRPGEDETFEGQPVAFHGFLLTSAGEFLDITHPRHKYSMAQRILRDGTIVGCYHDHDWTATMHGYAMPRTALSSAGVAADEVTVLDVPSSMHNGGTDRDRVVGVVMNTGTAYILERGTVQPYEAPGATHTEAWDMNAAGALVGVFADERSINHGFVWQDGRFTRLDFPGARDTVAFGINDHGTVVGSYRGVDGLRRGYVAARQ